MRFVFTKHLVLVGSMSGLTVCYQSRVHAAAHEAHDIHPTHAESIEIPDKEALKKSSLKSSNPMRQDPKYTAYTKPMKIFPFEVQTTAGQVVNQGSLKGRWSLITFGFTTCSDVCPLTMSRLKKELNKLPLESKKQLSVYFASLDPETDKAPLLEKYLKAWNIKLPVTGLIASKDVMHKFAKQFAPVTEKRASTALPVSKPDIIHTGIIFVINPAGELEGYFSETGKGEKLASGIQQLMRT